jgi:hypothetical protein
MDFLYQIFGRFCTITYAHIRSPEDLVRLDYLLDDFMGLSRRFFLAEPLLILTSQQLGNIIDLGMRALANGEKSYKSAKAAACFL